MFHLQTSAFRLGLMLLLCSAATGCANGDIWIYVDNGSKETMVVTVDGNEAATIPPGKFEKIECPAGERRFHIECGKRVVFDGTKNLLPSDQVLVTRRYFFNPDNRNRYLIYTVKYGSSPLEGLINAEGGSGDRESQIRAAYKKLCGEVKLLPTDAWFEVPTGTYVFAKPPEGVVTRGYTERRYFMTRVERKDYAFLEAAKKKTSPKERDLQALEDLLDKISD
jgi:hypothetical protein